jgi:protein-tyrosine phosphatase
MKVHFVCTGNLCRSPMAEALFEWAATARGLEAQVSSSGTWASAGEPATEGAVQAMRERGIDLGPHRSRPFDPAEGRGADLIVAMTSVQLREIEAILPGSSHKTRLLKELGEIEVPGTSGTPAGRLARLLAAPRPTWVRALDLDDPMGLPQGAYEVCAGELERGVAALLGHLVEVPASASDEN